MEDFKIGDYVRTKKYGIARVDDIKHCILLDRAIAGEPCIPSYCLTDEEYKNTVKKHSSNIIDLIEPGDYVNGYCVLDNVNNEFLIISKTEYNKDNKIYNKNIRSIITKEQLASIEYKL